MGETGAPRDRRVRRTKRALRDGLATLLAEKSIREITVRELTELVDINRATFYLHYSDIYDLLQQVEDEVVGEMGAIMARYLPASGEQRVYPLFTAVLEYIKANDRLCRMVLGKNSSRTFLDKLCRIIQDSTLQSWADNLRVQGGEEELARFSTFCVYGCVAVIEQWVEEGMSTPPEELAVQVGNMGMYGIGFLDHIPGRQPGQTL